MAVARLDSMLRTGPGGFVQDAGNLILARLKERRGDVRGALAAVRRRETFLTRPLYLSTFLREEGRLAALAGENDAAIEAYRHYLTLRAAPEPPLRSEVEYVRDELGKLEKAQRGEGVDRCSLTPRLHATAGCGLAAANTVRTPRSAVLLPAASPCRSRESNVLPDGSTWT